MIVTIRTLSIATALVAAPALAAPALAHEHAAAPPASVAKPSSGATTHDHAAPPATPTPDSHAGHEHGDHVHADHDMGGMDMGDMDDHDGHKGHDHPHSMMDFPGIQGSYPMMRDASGTSWQPDASDHGGVHAMRGPWMFMGHALINGVYDTQDGPRGDDKAFVSGMVMGAARYDRWNGDKVNFRLMLSPDAFSGKRGYPLLLATGETANGVTPLMDRQHPHELVMEASASYTHRLSNDDAIFVYAGLPGEPAFGPPAFMHRASTMDSPEAPISHHWLDSTHITFGVVTGGFVHRNWKLEASAFRGREPDQNRFDIESPELDSASVRASWNPTPHWALQASWADMKDVEQLNPGENETRWSASALYAAPLGGGKSLSATAAFGRKERSDGVDLNAGALEAALKFHAPWTLFARGEIIETDELGIVPHGPVETVGKVSVGAIRDFRVSPHALIGVGALAARSFVGDGLDASYGGDQSGGMAFVRLKIG